MLGVLTVVKGKICTRRGGRCAGEKTEGPVGVGHPSLLWAFAEQTVCRMGLCWQVAGEGWPCQNQSITLFPAHHPPNPYLGIDVWKGPDLERKAWSLASALSPSTVWPWASCCTLGSWLNTCRRRLATLFKWEHTFVHKGSPRGFQLNKEDESVHLPLFLPAIHWMNYKELFLNRRARKGEEVSGDKGVYNFKEMQDQGVMSRAERAQRASCLQQGSQWEACQLLPQTPERPRN